MCFGGNARPCCVACVACVEVSTSSRALFQLAHWVRCMGLGLRSSVGEGHTGGLGHVGNCWVSRSLHACYVVARLQAKPRPASSRR